MQEITGPLVWATCPFEKSERYNSQDFIQRALKQISKWSTAIKENAWDTLKHGWHTHEWCLDILRLHCGRSCPHCHVPLQRCHMWSTGKTRLACSWDRYRDKKAPSLTVTIGKTPIWFRREILRLLREARSSSFMTWLTNNITWEFSFHRFNCSRPRTSGKRLPMPVFWTSGRVLELYFILACIQLMRSLPLQKMWPTGHLFWYIRIT